MADVVSFYATVAGVLVLGFLGFLLFERTRVSDVLILVAAGYVAGPVLGVFDVPSFQAATPYVAALALSIILFDGGLGLKFQDLVHGLARSTLLGVAGFVFTVVLVAVAGTWFLGLAPLHATLLGAVLGGTSSIVVIPLVARLGVSEKTRVLLTVESAVTDVLCVVTALALVTMATTQAVDAQAGIRGIFAQFSIGIVLGIAAGAAWTQVMRFARKTPYSYMLTLAGILGLYAFTDYAGGNGAVSVLLFGLVVGNSETLSQIFRVPAVGFADDMRRFQGEITFFVRVFFFVYLGVILSPGVFTLAFLRDGLILLAACVVARGAAAYLAVRGDAELRRELPVHALLMPRGLAAAVLATVPVAAGVVGTEAFVDWAFALIVLTNVLATGVAIVPRRRDVPVKVDGPSEAPAKRA